MSHILIFFIELDEMAAISPLSDVCSEMNDSGINTDMADISSPTQMLANPHGRSYQVHNEKSEKFHFWN